MKDFLKNGCEITDKQPIVGQTAMLAFRPNLPRISYKEGWRAGAEKESETIVPCQAGSNQYASQAGGEIVIGKRRNQLALVRGRMPRDRRTELFIPFQSGNYKILYSFDDISFIKSLQ